MSRFVLISVSDNPDAKSRLSLRLGDESQALLIEQAFGPRQSNSAPQTNEPQDAAHERCCRGYANPSEYPLNPG
ncbi:MAG: hypothetical protein RLZZ09_3203 [Pseudomonadota bacterium]|jgi:hypothetical protein